MSITDFLFSLHKLLAWLFALLTVLLPQHLLAPLPAANPPATVYAAPQLCANIAAPPRKRDRIALPSADAEQAGASAPASETHDATASAAKTKR